MIKKVMIKETYCSYEVSKLLKKKGFDGDGGDCECHMFYCEYTEERIMPICEIGLVPDNEEVFFAPTHQMAMAWLREVHHIAINIGWGEIFEGQYQWWSIVLNMDSGDILCEYDYHISYEQSCEAAIKNCLEKLI